MNPFHRRPGNSKSRWDVMLFNQVQREPQGNASGLKGWAHLLGTPMGKGESQSSPASLWDPITSFTMDPMKRRPRTMVVTISKLKSIRWKFCQGAEAGGHVGPLPMYGLFAYPPPPAQSFPSGLSPLSDLHRPPAESDQENT